MLIFRHTKVITARLLAAVIAGILVWCVGGAVVAQSAAAIAQGFETTDANVAGSIMSLKPGTPDTVQLATTATANQLMGVVGEKPLIALSNNPTQTQVVTSGVTLTLVSDLNGDIKSGDKITASPISGVGMKATEAVEVVGTAQANLSSAAKAVRTIPATDGSQHEVHIASLPVQIGVTFYQPSSNTILPVFLQNFANNIAGHDVSLIRVAIATVVLLLAFISIAVLLYSAVKSSIISIGRNPLSEHAVRQSLLQIGLTIIGILLITLTTIYLILIT